MKKNKDIEKKIILDHRKTIVNRSRRYGKSTMVTQSFVNESKAKKPIIYNHPDYVCYSRKALEKLFSIKLTTLMEKVEAMKRYNARLNGEPVAYMKDIPYNDALTDVLDLIRKERG